MTAIERARRIMGKGEKKYSMKPIQQMVKKQVLSLIFMVIMALASAWFWNEGAIFLGKILDDALAKDIPVLKQHAWACFASFCLYLVIALIMIFLREQFIMKVTNDIRGQIMSSLFHGPQSLFFSKKNEDYFNIMDNAVDHYRDDYLNALVALLISTFSFAITSIQLVQIDLYVFLISLVAAILPMLVARLVSAKLDKADREQMEAMVPLSRCCKRHYKAFRPSA